MAQIPVYKPDGAHRILLFSCFCNIAWQTGRPPLIVYGYVSSEQERPEAAGAGYELPWEESVSIRTRPQVWEKRTVLPEKETKNQPCRHLLKHPGLP